MLPQVEFIKQVLKTKISDPDVSATASEACRWIPNMEHGFPCGTNDLNSSQSRSPPYNIPTVTRAQSSVSDNGSIASSEASSPKSVTVAITIFHVNGQAVMIGNHSTANVTGSSNSDLEQSDSASFTTDSNPECDVSQSDISHHEEGETEFQKPIFDLDFEEQNSAAAHVDYPASYTLDTRVPNDNAKLTLSGKIGEDLYVNSLEMDLPSKENGVSSKPSNSGDYKHLPPPRVNPRSEGTMTGFSKESPTCRPRMELRNVGNSYALPQGNATETGSTERERSRLGEQSEYMRLLAQPYQPSVPIQEVSRHSGSLSQPSIPGRLQSNCTGIPRIGNPLYTSSWPSISQNGHPWGTPTHGKSTGSGAASTEESEHGFADDMSLDHQYLTMDQTRLLGIPKRSEPSLSERLTSIMVKKARKLHGFYTCFDMRSNKEIHAILRQKRDGSYLLWQADSRCFVVSVVYLHKVYNFRISTDGFTLFLAEDGPRAVDLGSLISLYVREKRTLPLRMPERNKENSTNLIPLPPRPSKGFLRLVEPVVLNDNELHKIIKNVRRQHSSQ